MGKFSDEVRRHVHELKKERLPSFVRQVAQVGAKIIKEDIPVDTGFARSTIGYSVNSVPRADLEKPKSEAEGEDPSIWKNEEDNTIVLLAGLKVGDTAYVYLGANYAAELEDKSPFVAPAVAKLKTKIPEIVQKLKR